MRSHWVRLGVFLLSVYVVAGILVFPTWWYGILREGGVEYLLYSASREFLGLNAAAVGLVGLLVVAYERAHSQRRQLAVRIGRYLESPSYFGAISLLIILSGFRLQMVGMERLSFRQPASGSESSGSEDQPVRLPVDFVWLDDRRVVAAYEQIAPDLKLTGRTTTQGDKVSVELGASAGPVKGKGAVENTAGQTASFSAVDPSVVRKTVDLINGLAEKRLIRTLKTIESQSAEVKALDEAVAILHDKFNLSIKESEVAAARKGLVEKNIAKELPAELSEANWVLIGGDIFITQQPSGTTLTFEYVPSVPGKAVFSCQVPLSGQVSADLRALPDKSTWRLTIFGRLLQRPSSAKSGAYTLLCYAVFR
jgi:hypothetical protein